MTTRKTFVSSREDDARAFLELQARRVADPAFDPRIESAVAGGPEGALDLRTVVAQGGAATSEWVAAAAEWLARQPSSGLFAVGGDGVFISRLRIDHRDASWANYFARIQRGPVALSLRRAETLFRAGATRGPGEIRLELQPHLILDVAGLVGHAIWEFVGRKDLSDVAFRLLAHALSDRLEARGEEVLPSLVRRMIGWRGAIEDANTLELARSAFQWARAGFPRIRVDGVAAASHCFTHIPPEQAPDVRWPFDAFVVEVPPGLLLVEGLGGGEPAWATEALFARTNNVISEHKFRCHVIAPDGTNLSQGELSSGALLTCPAEHIPFPEPMRGLLVESAGLADADANAIGRAKRIAAGVCMRLCTGLDDGARLEASGTLHRFTSARLPRLQQKLFIYADDVEIDLRDFARETASTRAVDWKSRWPVRGHYANLAVGKGRADRRRTWRRPCWKGPADAPMRVRDYVLSPEGAGGDA